jgi:hypothetical protein
MDKAVEGAHSSLSQITSRRLGNATCSGQSSSFSHGKRGFSMQLVGSRLTRSMNDTRLILLLE